MPRVLIWDWPVRLFHWMLVAGVLTAFGLAKLAPKHGTLFHYHAMIGILVGVMVVLRIIWGVVGTRHARFSSFAHGPRAVLHYFRDIAAGRSTRYVGHNPGSSWIIYLMMALVLGVVGAGLLTAAGYHAFEDIHETLVYVLLATAGVHVLGVIVHTIRHRENITLSMITGRKDTEAVHAIGSSRPAVGIVFVLLMLFLGGSLYHDYDAATRSTRIPLIGKVFRLDKAPKPGKNKGNVAISQARVGAYGIDAAFVRMGGEFLPSTPLPPLFPGRALSHTMHAL